MNAERPTFKQVQDQHKAGHVESSVLVKRGDGSVHVGRVNYNGQDRDNYYVEIVDDEGRVSHKQVASEALSDKSQKRLARELGGPLLDKKDVEQAETLRKIPDEIGRKVLEEVGIDEPTTLGEQNQSEEDRTLAEYKELIKDLSENDQNALWKYVTARHPYEKDSAKRRMSYGLQQNPQLPQLIREAQEVYGRLKKAREANKE